jgi:hypothetical protein
MGVCYGKFFRLNHPEINFTERGFSAKKEPSGGNFHSMWDKIPSKEFPLRGGGTFHGG